jgi:hypothetical protein
MVIVTGPRTPSGRDVPRFFKDFLHRAATVPYQKAGNLWCQGEAAKLDRGIPSRQETVCQPTWNLVKLNRCNEGDPTGVCLGTTPICCIHQ